MIKKIITSLLLILLGTFSPCNADGYAKTATYSQLSIPDLNSIDTILERLKEKTRQLKSYQTQIEYLFSQPLFDSQTLRKGMLYYIKQGHKSALRINFETIKQDDEKEQKNIEQFIFDGIWLTHIDYNTKQAKMQQLVEPNEPVDAFDLVSRNFPIIGFTNIEDLRKQFEIELPVRKNAEQNNFIQLHLKTKPDSVYKDEYRSIDFWLDPKLYLPAKIVAVSTEDDIYQMAFVKPIVNRELNKKIFDFEIPKGFDKSQILLKEKTSGK